MRSKVRGDQHGVSQGQRLSRSLSQAKIAKKKKSRGRAQAHMRHVTCVPYETVKQNTGTAHVSHHKVIVKDSASTWQPPATTLFEAEACLFTRANRGVSCTSTCLLPVRGEHSMMRPRRRKVEERTRSAHTARHAYHANSS